MSDATFMVFIGRVLVAWVSVLLHMTWAFPSVPTVTLPASTPGITANYVAPLTPCTSFLQPVVNGCLMDAPNHPYCPPCSPPSSSLLPHWSVVSGVDVWDRCLCVSVFPIDECTRIHVFIRDAIDWQCRARLHPCSPRPSSAALLPPPRRIPL
jgi:hypothetical protein